MAVQAAIIGVPLYWLATDPDALKDPELLLGVPIMLWLITLTLTEGLTRLYDWCRFRLWPLVQRPFGGVQKTERETDRTIAASRSLRKLT